MIPFSATTRVSRPWLLELTNTFLTSPPSKSTDSTKNTRSAAPPDSMKRPGATRLQGTSSRCAKRVRASAISPCDHGETKKASKPIAITIGHAKRSTGPTHASRLCPVANHTTISESRYARDRVISTATNSVSVRMTGSQVSAVSATSCSTAWLSTRPPAAWPRMRTRPTEKRIEKSTVNTALAVLVSSAMMERRKIIRRRARCRGKPAGDDRPRYILRGGSRSRARTPRRARATCRLREECGAHCPLDPPRESRGNLRPRPHGRWKALRPR